MRAKAGAARETAKTAAVARVAVPLQNCLCIDVLRRWLLLNERTLISALRRRSVRRFASRYGMDRDGRHRRAPLLRRRATTVIERNHPLGASLVLFLFGLTVPLTLASVIAHRLRGRGRHVAIVGLR